MLRWDWEFAVTSPSEPFAPPYLHLLRGHVAHLEDDDEDDDGGGDDDDDETQQ